MVSLIYVFYSASEIKLLKKQAFLKVQDIITGLKTWNIKMQ